MQQNDIILSIIVSHLKETMLRVESLANRPVADGNLAKFWKTVEDTYLF